MISGLKPNRKASEVNRVHARSLLPQGRSSAPERATQLGLAVVVTGAHPDLIDERKTEAAAHFPIRGGKGGGDLATKFTSHAFRVHILLFPFSLIRTQHSCQSLLQKRQ